jgi:hypothetical protein
MDRRRYDDVAAFSLQVDPLGQRLRHRYAWMPKDNVPTAPASHLVCGVWEGTVFREQFFQ